MDISNFAKSFPRKVERLREFTHSTRIKDLSGVEAVQHVKASFDNEGFTDEYLDPWKDVKRRDQNSSWYGHSGQFSKERTTAPIITKQTNITSTVTGQQKTGIFGSLERLCIAKGAVSKMNFDTAPFKMSQNVSNVRH